MQRKITLFLIFIVIILNICTVPALAGTVPPTITLGNVIGIKGSEIEIPIVLKNNTGFANLGIEIGYDSNAMTLVNVDPNSNVGGIFTPAQKYTINPYNMCWDNALNNMFNGTLVTLSFKIITNQNGVYPITVDYYKGRNGNYIDGVNINYDENIAPVGFEYKSGEIKIEDEHPSINLNDNLSVTLRGNKSVGIIYAALYGENNQMKQVKTCIPSETFNLKFDSPKKGDRVKIMWWDEDFRSVCKSESIILP